MPKTFPSCRVDVNDKDSAVAYEWALGEYRTDANGEHVLDEDGDLIPINPIRFPIDNAFVVINGSRATISVPRPGQANKVIDKLMSVAEPKPATVRGRRTQPGDSAVTITGISERMLQQGISPADATVTFLIGGSNVTDRKA